MPHPENNLIRRRHRQIFIANPPKIEPVPPMIDGWLAGFIERLARIVRKIGGKK
jgi:hypothetical protein